MGSGFPVWSVPARWFRDIRVWDLGYELAEAHNMWGLGFRCRVYPRVSDVVPVSILAEIRGVGRLELPAILHVVARLDVSACRVGCYVTRFVLHDTLKSIS